MTRPITAIIALSLVCGCGALDEDMSDLFKGISGGAYGNTASEVSPAQANGIAPLGWGLVKTVLKFPGHLRKGNMLQEQDPAIIAASVYAEPQQPGTIFAGPITGIALWGSGGSATNVAEFDVPVNTSVDPDFVLSDPAPFDTPRGGTMIAVVGTSLEIRARNDARLVPAGPNGDGSNQLPIGVFGTFTSALTAPTIVSGALGKGVTTSNGATKTVWAVNAANNAGSLGNASSVFVRIPPFAKSFRICRTHTFIVPTLAGPIDFLVFGNSANIGDGAYSVAAGVLAPEVKLSGQETTIQIVNRDAANLLTALFVVFFLAI